MRRLPILLLLLSLLTPSNVVLDAPSAVQPGEVFDVVAHVYTTPQPLTLSVSGGDILDNATWQAEAAPGFPVRHVWRVKATGDKVVITAGGAQAVVNVRTPQVGLCRQLGCYPVFAPWVGRG